jgi:hypothetical protein
MNAVANANLLIHPRHIYCVYMCELVKTYGKSNDQQQDELGLGFR